MVRFGIRKGNKAYAKTRRPPYFVGAKKKKSRFDFESSWGKEGILGSWDQQHDGKHVKSNSRS